MTTTIAITSGKGGVGKSLVSANLALALKAQGFRVGLLDADLYGPSLKKMLTIDRFPQREEGVLLPALCHGIKMVSMAFFQEEEEASAVRAPIANRLIHQLIHEVSWGNLDFLIVGDTKPTKRKVEQAKQLKIKIISEKDWNKILNN